MRVLWPVTTSDGNPDGWMFWCPGCEGNHWIPGDRSWQVEGDLDCPTVHPSLITDPDGDRCHLLVRNGKIEYLEDCHHDMAGMTVEMVPEGQ